MEKSLYQITQEQAELFNQIEELDGELTPELETELQLNAENFETKARGYIWHIKKLEDKNDRAAKEFIRLQQLTNRNNKVIERLKDNLKYALIIFGESKEVDTFTLGISTSESTDIFDAELVPSEYKVTETITTTTTKIPKDEVKKAIKAGIEVPGAQILINKRLTIK